MAKRGSDRHKYRPLPSLYTSRPLAPSVTSHFDAKTASAAEQDNVNRLAQLAQRGGAAVFLRSVLEDVHRRELRKRRYRLATSGVDTEVGEDEDSDERELRAKGFVHKRRRRKQKKGSESGEEATTGLDGDDEEGSETEGGKKRKRKSGKRARASSRKMCQMLKIPEIAAAEKELRSSFPSDDLLHSIHSHTSRFLESQYSLVPPLTPSSPSLPEDLRQHFDGRAAVQVAEEERIAREGTSTQFAAMKRMRVHKRGGGLWHGVWTDAGRAFEGNALVALGMLSQLLVEDAARSAETPATTPEQPIPAGTSPQPEDDDLPELPQAGPSTSS
ncbi:hypothetical protein JCM11641_000123 [Rhodosporidiobolus odoratus]